MDVSSLVPQDRTIEIKHPVTLEPIGLAVTIRHSSTPEVRAVKDRHTTAALKLRGRALTAQHVEQNAFEIVCAGIVSWKWKDGGNFQGKEPEFTVQNAREIFKAIPWLRDQIDEEQGNDADFFAK